MNSAKQVTSKPSESTSSSGFRHPNPEIFNNFQARIISPAAKTATTSEPTEVPVPTLGLTKKTNECWRITAKTINAYATKPQPTLNLKLRR